jgi:DNA-binding FrmR family transcriptional regulator
MHVFRRVGFEFRAAVLRAEIDGLAVVLELVPSARGIDLHAADGVHGGAGGMIVVMMSGVVGGRRTRAAAAAPAVFPGFLAVLRVHVKLHALAESTLWGYIGSMRTDIKTSCQKRLNRIEGQVRGLAKMVDEDRYCIDIVTQISAVRSALRRVEEEILKDHVAHCVEHAINSGDKADQRRKIAELMDVVGRVDR